MERIALHFLTGNRHKYLEILNIARQINFPIDIKMGGGKDKIEIQSDSLEKIVEFATRHAYEKGYDNFFIEDAGLFIEALKGFPGPYSHYVYATIGIQGILKLMRDITKRKAYFKSVIGLCLNGDIKIFVGITNGLITRAPRGSYGFGFDPIFIPEGYSKTFAEMSMEEKNRVSHRGKAAKKMFEYLKARIIS